MKLSLFRNVDLNYLIRNENSKIKFIKVNNREYEIMLIVDNINITLNRNNNVIEKNIVKNNITKKNLEDKKEKINFEYTNEVKYRKILKIKEKVSINKSSLSKRQMVVADYIINNIQRIPQIKDVNEFSNILGINSIVVNVALSMMEIESFAALKEIITTELNQDNLAENTKMEDVDKLISDTLYGDNHPKVIVKKEINKKKVKETILKILDKYGPKNKGELFKLVVKCLDKNNDYIIDQNLLIEILDDLLKEKKISLNYGKIKLENKNKSLENHKKNEDISIEEVSIIMMKILLDKGEKSKNELFKDVLEFLSNKNSDNGCKEYLINAIDLLLEENKVSIYLGKIKLNKNRVNIDEIKSFERSNLFNSNKRNKLEENNIENGKKEKYNECKINILDELAIENVFKENRFNEFKKFCYYNKIKKVTEVTYDDIIDFKYSKEINRQILTEIAQIINQYVYEYSNSSINLELEQFRKEISSKLYKLNDKQKVIGKFIIENLEKIDDISSIKELADSIGISQFVIPTVLIKLNLGTFTVFKKNLRRYFK